MRTALALIVFGSLAFIVLSRDFVASATGRPFLGARPHWDASNPSGSQRSRIENLDLNGVRVVRVETMNGEINVRGPDATDSNADAAGSFASNNDAAGSFASNNDAAGLFASNNDAVRITERGSVSTTISRNGDRLLIKGEGRRRLFDNAGVQFDLNLRNPVRLELDSSNGEISVTGQMVAVKANTSNGKIRVVGAGQSEISLESGNGELQVEGTQGPLSASTSNGEIIVRNVQPDHLRLESGNGQITLGQVRFGSGSHQISSSNGEIIVRDATDASFTIDTSSGQVVLERVELRPGPKSSVENSSDDIRISGLNAPDGLRLTGETGGGSTDVQLPGFNVRVEENRFEAGRDGSNPASLNLNTSGGSVRVRP
jgi:DUF4097 and DUF4098 domain-containing protein YvlB